MPKPIDAVLELVDLATVAITTGLNMPWPIATTV
jgi:hypothetical protein